MSLKLPAGSTRKQRIQYEEFNIPAPTSKPFDQQEELVKIKNLPSYIQPGFKGYENLNRIQSRLYKCCLESDENLLLCAPTGAGKTNVALLCMLREIGKHINEDGTINTENFKIIYIAPMRSLVQEMVGTIGERLSPYNLTVSELTGDHQLSQEEMLLSQVIVCTPEKWDIITRKGGKNHLVQYVKLMVIDEIHLLNCDRGPVIEALVARTIRNIGMSLTKVRIIGLSATLYNYTDVATFLNVDFETGLYFFDNSFRPVPLSQQYIGIKACKPYQRRLILNEILYAKVIEKAGKNQVLIFVHSRKETGNTARVLRDLCSKNKTINQFLCKIPLSVAILKTKANEVKNGDLKNLLVDGFAIHHAGMSKEDRTLVEEMFAHGHVQVLVSTATLAWGVNLPAQTVIIKGTEVYNAEKDSWVEISALDVIQMLGRAGRPQYDKKGEGILITKHDKLLHYLTSLTQPVTIESQFISKLPDMLNAEIVLEAVNNLEEAVKWLSYTYLFVRMLKSPAHYGVDKIINDNLTAFRTQLIKTAAVHLEINGQIEYDKNTGTLKSTELGRIGSYYYCSFDTMATYNKHLKPNLTDMDILRVFTMSEEFRYITVREEEKVELLSLRTNIPYPINESLKQASAKVNILLQAYISQLNFSSFSLMSEMECIILSAARLFKAIFEIALFRGWPKLAERTLSLCKSVDRRMWQPKTPLRQFPQIPQIILKGFENIASEILFELGLSEIEDIVNKPDLSKSIYKAIRLIPKLNISIDLISTSKALPLKVVVDVTPEFEWDEGVHGTSEHFWLIAIDKNLEVILHYELFIIKQKHFDHSFHISFLLPLSASSQFYVRVISDLWFGSDYLISLSLKSEHLESPASKTHELLTSKTNEENLLEILSEVIENKTNNETIIPFILLRTNLSKKSIIPIKNDTIWCRNAFLLLYAHLWRIEVDPRLKEEKDTVLLQSINLLQSCLSVLELNGWLLPAIAVINLMQMLTQAVWDHKLSLLQLPNMTLEIFKKYKKVKKILPDKEDINLLLYAGYRCKDVAELKKVYDIHQGIKLTFEIENKENITQGKSVHVIVSVTRQNKAPASVIAPFLSFKRKEYWWILIGQPCTNSLLCIKKCIIPQKGIIKLNFIAPAPGFHSYKLYFMCDGYLSFEKEHDFQILVK